MSVRIRLTRIGKKNSPSYRIVVAERRSSSLGKAVEIIGHYNPSHHPAQISLKKDRIDYWVKKGASLSETVSQLVAGSYRYNKYQPKSGSPTAG